MLGCLSTTTGFMVPLYENHQSEKAFSAWWLSCKDCMKPVVAN